MYLNSAKVTSWVLNGKDYTGSRKRFMKALCETHNFTVNLVLGNKLLGRGNVSFMENSGWVIAHVDSRFAFDKDEHISGLTISICNNGNEILSSETEVSYFVSGNMSTDADLYFIVGSVYAYNEAKSALPESFFRASDYDKLTKISYEDLPSPIGPEPSDVLRVITDEFLVTKDGINIETAYSVLEIPNEAVEYLSQSGALENFSAKFMNSHSDSSIWTGIFYANDYMMLYKTGDMPDSGDFSGISLTTVHPSVYDGKDHAYNPIKVDIPGDPVTIKTYINGAENSDNTYWPYTTSDDAYTVVVPARKEGDEPSANVTITSVEYKVTNDYTEEDDYYSTDWSSRVQKNAYTVVEADRDEWDAFCEQYGHPQNINLTFSQDDSSSLTFYASISMKDDINAEIGTISMQDGDEWDSPYVLTTINQKHPTRHEDAIDSISFNIKTYIDGEENTNVSYIPVFGEDYEFNIDMQEYGYTPPVINFQYEASKEGYYKFRFSITSIDESEVAGFDSASLTFKAWKEADSDTFPYYKYSGIESVGGEYHVDFDKTPDGLGPRGNGIIYKGEGTDTPCGTMIYRVFSYYGDEIQSNAQNISYPASLPMTKITD